MMTITKVKAFYKYKGYRNIIIKKFFKKAAITTLVMAILAICLFLNYEYILKHTSIKQINVGRILNLENIPETKPATVLKSQPLKQEAVKQEIIKDEKSEVLTINENQSTEKKSQDDVLRKLQELERENKVLKEDNIHLQNSLKIAASRGARPRNYRLSPQVTSRSGAIRGKHLGEFTVTAYTPTKEECGNDRGITSSGNPIVPGVTVAVDKNYWPVGTVFYVKGLGYVVAMDSGGAIKGRNRFDFAVFDKEYAKRLGRRKFEVYLISLGKGKVEDLNF